MTLSLDVHIIDENGIEQRLDLGLGGHLAGVEVARTELGLTILPSLAHNLYLVVKKEELDQFKNEALLIQHNLQIVIENTTFGEETIMGRTNNFINTVEKAKLYDGWITIG